MKGIDLRKLRKKLNYTQEEMAFALEVAKDTIGNWEKKDRLSEKAERIIKDYFNKKKIDITGDFNQVGDNNKNFLSDSQNKFGKENLALAEENKRLTQELLECKSKLIELLTKKEG